MGNSLLTTLLGLLLLGQRLQVLTVSDPAGE